MCSRTARRNGGVFKVFSVLFLLVAVACGIVALVMPKHYRDQVHARVKGKTLLDGLHADAMKRWRQPEDATTLEVHMFNITNPYEVLQGAKPRLLKMPPLRYTKHTVRHDLYFSADRSTLRYKDLVYYLPIGDTLSLENEAITSINMPFQYVAGQSVDLLYYNMTDFERLFVQRSRGEILWGYNDPMYKFLHDIDPEVPRHYSGLLRNMSVDDLESVGHARIRTGLDIGALAREIVAWDGMASLNCCTFGSCGPTDRGGERMAAWMSEEANHFTGSFGDQWPSHISHVPFLPMFVPEMFRSVKLMLQSSEIHVHEVKLHRFTLSNSTFENADTNPINAPYYAHGPNGLFNVSNCRSRARVFVSKPHFLGGDAGLVTNLTGFAPPNEIQHDSYFDVEPITGSRMQYHRRLQLNTRIEPTSISFTSNWYFKDVRTTYVPLVWFDECSSSRRRHSSLIMSTASWLSMCFWVDRFSP